MIKSSWKEVPWNTKRQRRTKKNKSKSARKSTKKQNKLVQNEHLNLSMETRLGKKAIKAFADK